MRINSSVRRSWALPVTEAIARFFFFQIFPERSLEGLGAREYWRFFGTASNIGMWPAGMYSAGL
jgi:hypothetical protein